MEYWSIGKDTEAATEKFTFRSGGEFTMQGRVVIVTGGAKGIGRHAAHTLAKAGAKIVLADADAERLHKTLGEIQKSAPKRSPCPPTCATRKTCASWFTKSPTVSARSTR